MPNPFYTNTFSGQPGQTARSESVDTELTGIQSGFDGVQAYLNRAIVGAIGETLNALPAAAVRANKALSFDADGQPRVAAPSLNWRGFWQPNTTYFVGDIVQIAVHQNFEYCTVQHLSGATYAGTNWATFLDLSGIQWWNYFLVTQGTTALAPGDSVFVDASLGNVVLNLPVGVLGQSPINITHVAGTLGAGQSITINATGGQTLMGNAQTSLSVDVVNASLSLAYCSASLGWRLRTMG